MGVMGARKMSIKVKEKEHKEKIMKSLLTKTIHQRLGGKHASCSYPCGELIKCPSKRPNSDLMKMMIQSVFHDSGCLGSVVQRESSGV